MLDLDDYKLGRLQWSKADKDVHDAEVDIVLRGRFLITLDEVSLTGRLSLEGSLSKQVLHERTDVETDLRPEQREYLQVAKNSADALLTVINDILDFSKIEAGMLDLNVVDFQLRDSIEEIVKTLALSAHQKSLELVCDINDSVPDFVRCDQMRVRQVLVNLVGNAIKFTAQGEVVVSVEARKGGSDARELLFTIRDTGIGIAPEKQEAIFHAFTQADSSSTRRQCSVWLSSYFQAASSCMDRANARARWARQCSNHSTVSSASKHCDDAATARCSIAEADGVESNM